jgi:preprotein translocase subunit SecE
MAQKQGSDQPKRPERRTPAPAQTSDRTSPTQFFSEVRGELRKVAWPTKNEVVNSTIIVLIAVVFMTSLIFGADYVFAKGVLFLYD